MAQAQVGWKSQPTQSLAGSHFEIKIDISTFKLPHLTQYFAGFIEYFLQHVGW